MKSRLAERIKVNTFMDKFLSLSNSSISIVPEAKKTSTPARIPPTVEK